MDFFPKNFETHEKIITNIDEITEMSGYSGVLDLAPNMISKILLDKIDRIGLLLLKTS